MARQPYKASSTKSLHKLYRQGGLNVQKEKNAVVTFRTTAAFKGALKKAAESERRSQSNFIENLVLEYCERNGILAGGALKRKGWDGK
jgi:hypothetical protein